MPPQRPTLEDTANSVVDVFRPYLQSLQDEYNDLRRSSDEATIRCKALEQKHQQLVSTLKMVGIAYEDDKFRFSDQWKVIPELNNRDLSPQDILAALENFQSRSIPTSTSDRVSGIRDENHDAATRANVPRFSPLETSVRKDSQLENSISSSEEPQTSAGQRLQLGLPGPPATRKRKSSDVQLESGERNKLARRSDASEKMRNSDSPIVNKMFKAFMAKSRGPPTTTAEYKSFFLGGLDLDLKKEDRELAAWVRASKGFLVPPETNNKREWHSAWMEAMSDVFPAETKRDNVVCTLPSTQPPSNLDDYSHLLQLENVLEKHSELQGTQLLFDHILSATAAIDFAYEHCLRSEEQKIKFTKLRYIHQFKNTHFEDISDDYDQCCSRIKTTHQNHYMLWRARVYGKDITTRNRILDAYKALGPQILLDPAFSTPKMRQVSASYPHFVAQTLQNLPSCGTRFV
ncbi:hypothetical protein MIND_01067800 [Mycena indigotica]|uniref:Uncharacterized protein n=1 Tax=Mycena indigotica TaxID=2126181 RepID=A0A8H6SAS3_9AGAR|nr:uncharacterized protein MIND_01067800 [Mycena indigotica]KAF7295286.1 hypothetical protein MIND_01067800 [Mycena indigotica]